MMQFLAARGSESQQIHPGAESISVERRKVVSPFPAATDSHPVGGDYPLAG